MTADRTFLLDARRVLYWIYAGRMIVALGVYAAALAVGVPGLAGAPAFTPAVRGFAVAGLAATALFTPISYWYSHRHEAEPGLGFVHLQALFDVLLVTGVVHLTGGSESVFPPMLYVALVSAYALLLPLPSAIGLALTSGVAYLADVALFYPTFLGLGVVAQVVIFTIVATVGGLIGGRLREASAELSSVEDELRRLQLGTSDILRTIASGVITLDSEGKGAFMNPAAEELLGVTSADWVGKDVRGLLAERAPGVAEAVDRTLSGGRPARNKDVEIQPRRAGARPRPVAVNTDILDRPGSAPVVTVVLQDMRLVRQLEDLHLRAGRLEAVAELSASLAHEIKNPLASIRSAVEQIGGSGSDEADRVTLTRLIIRETDRLSRLLTDFNDFARVDVFERKPILAENVVREAIQLVEQRPEATDRVTFHANFEGELDDLWGDPDLIHRTLVNLLLNAIQVGDQDERINVRVEVDTLSPDMVPDEIAPGVPVRIRVTDDGPGIDPDDLGRIFDPFYTRRKGGSGMGLAIAHRAIQAHGGSLLVRSELGRGATFAIVLPRRDYHERTTMHGPSLSGEPPDGEAKQESDTE